MKLRFSLGSTPIDRRRFLRYGTLFGSARPRFLSRAIGGLLLAAGFVAAISLLFPDAPYADVGVADVATVIALVFGIALLAGIADHAPTWVFQLLVAGSVALACAGIYGGGSPSSGAQFFLLWVVPLGFAFFNLRQAALQVLWLGISYGIVLAVQMHQFPAIGPAGLLIGMWFITVATCSVVGGLIRRISRSHRVVDRRLQHAYAKSPIGSAFLTPGLVFLQANEALCVFLQRQEDELIEQPLSALVHPDDLPLLSGLEAKLLEHTDGVELRFLTDGVTRVAALSATLVLPESGKNYIFMQFVDITDHRRDRDALARRAIHDPLTGLFNRALLMERLNAAFDDDRPESIAVLMIDLDQFKVVNDSLGHEIGDEFLRSLAPRLAAAIQPGDTLARLGGDEFVVLCKSVQDESDAWVRANTIAAALREPVRVLTGEYSLSASIGLAISSMTTETAASLLRDADAAMYRAKGSGRNRIELFDESMREEVLSKLELENDLHHAVERGELQLDYQPIIDLVSGRVIMVEALIRWSHPRRGRLLPDDFIHLAEETGLITHVGEFVLATAVAQLAQWQHELDLTPPLGLTVNVSGRQLSDPRFSGRLAGLLQAYRIAPGSLGLEITESVLLAKDLPTELFSELRQLGVLTMLDDFGTGYSSLAYLEQFSVDILKVDQAFVSGIERSPQHRAVLEAILGMAHALDIDVIVEGAENSERIATMIELGCRAAQGNALATPMPAEQVASFLEQRQAPAKLAFG